MAGATRHLRILALLCLLVALIYVNSLRNPFVIDDQHIIVRNFLLRQWSLRDIASSHLFAPLGIETQYYRPLTLLTFAINYSYSGLDPIGYHLVSVALHLLVVALVYLVFVHFVSPWVAGFSAALFAAHPANVQAISYISSRSDPLYSALSLLCILCWVKGRRPVGAPVISLRLLSLALFFLALFAKESAVVAPTLAIMIDWIGCNDKTWREKPKQDRIWILGFVLVLIVYIAIRLHIAGYGLTMEASKESWRPGGELNVDTRMLLALQTLGNYVTLALFPLNLSFFRTVNVPESPFETGVLFGTASLIVLAGSALQFLSRCKVVSCGLLWFLISILPVLNLTFLNAPMMEHWLYLPLAGFALGLVAGIHLLAQRLDERRTAALGLALVLLLLSARTAFRNADWGDPVVLFQKSTRLYPQEERNWFLLAYAFLERGMAAQAVQAYRTGLALKPQQPYGWSGLGEALAIMGKHGEAEESFLKAVSLMPENPWFHYVLAVQKVRMGKSDEAITTLKRSIRLKPPIPMAYHVLGSAYLRQGMHVEAEASFKQALTLLPENNPVHGAIHIELARLYLTQGDTKAAQLEQQIAERFASMGPAATRGANVK